VEREDCANFYFGELASPTYVFQILITSVPTVNFPNEFGTFIRWIWKANPTLHSGTYGELVAITAGFRKGRFKI